MALPTAELQKQEANYTNTNGEFRVSSFEFCVVLCSSGGPCKAWTQHSAGRAPVSSTGRRPSPSPSDGVPPRKGPRFLPSRAAWLIHCLNEACS